MQRWVRDLNRLYRDEPALHRLDCEGTGFEWIDADDREHSVFAWVRRDGTGRSAIIVVNMTPVPRPGYRLGVPDAEAGSAWREALNSDSAFYGGGNLGNGGAPIPVEPIPTGRHWRSLGLVLPPLAAVFLLPCRADHS